MDGLVNERQLEVLRWISDGCPEGKWPEDGFPYKTSAAALKSRGLVTITRHGSTWTAAVTKAGTHYLEHGTYPPSASPKAPTVPAVRAHRAVAVDLGLGDGASETLAQAKALIAQLRDSERITVADPVESTRARYRRVLHACRVHHLVPEDHELRFTGRSSGEIVIMLSTGSSADSSDWDRIRTTTRKITTNLDVLRKALETTSILKPVSEPLRPRAIEIVLDLAEHLRAHDFKLGANTKLKTPKLFVQDDTRRRNLYLTEILNEVPHVTTAAEQRELLRAPWTRIPKFDSSPSGRLQLHVERDGTHEVKIDRQNYRYERNGDTWSDEKKKPLERQVREIAREIKKGVIDDDDALERQKQRHAEAHEAHQREQAAQLRAWENLRDHARAKAILELREATFARAFEAWQGAQELRAFAKQLETEATAQGLLANRPKLREWLEWARIRADDIDPLANLEHLDDGVFDAEPSADDLRPHMEGWDPLRHRKDYSAGFGKPEQQQVHLPQPRAWHMGMRDRPSWWRY
ncbi:hypothetical protein CQ019_01880 [Arthrobacter sp. MYb229]|uniref:hypothetical protein n=1 Tax=unclassified Arthrobacter TaxID=235627 RepID=UPI000CFB958B|nr:MULTISPECIES: hypothetical protein [unclassified Arthrobacter]PRA06181.1 hypothetical protein CQ019_01880 [Arthrobacter sp. MYb229]PRB53083.1 hypothetical protein CQ013_01880 [Arthrobacter sp. MYb216]